MIGARVAFASGKFGDFLKLSEKKKFQSLNKIQ